MAEGGFRLSRRGLVWLGFYAAILASWLALFLWQQAMPLAALRGMPSEFWAALCQGADAGRFPALAAMWALMAMAMMLPTFAPALRTYAGLPGPAHPGAAELVALVAGYLLVWSAASLIGAGLQREFARLALLSPVGQSLSPWLSAALMLAAGAYQFTSLKAACLSRCRMPITYFMERWAPGLPHVLRMGAELGLFCLGCCWALMLLAFVGGMMNLMWMGVATLFMIFEKLPDLGRHLTRPAGMLLLLAGLVQAGLALV